MSGFTLAWLALREPYDRDARSADLARAFAAALPLAARIVDLGAGSGANMRYLAPITGPLARWRLVDSDGGLLAAARGEPAGDSRIVTLQIDLARDLAAALVDADAITASALLDLASASWLDRLATEAAARRLPMLLALSADGRHKFSPADQADGMVLAAFAQHQRRDKGLGSAKGPDAPGFLAARLKDLGAEIRCVASDWRIGGESAPMLSAMVEGIAAAAGEAAPEQSTAIALWRRRRLAAIGSGSLTLRVGHQDLLALWPKLVAPA